MVRIFFLHANFPGQFKNICMYLRDIPGVQVFFISTANDNNLRGVRRKNIDLRNDLPYLARMEARGLAAIHAIQEFCAAGEPPDILLVHPGWGDALFLKLAFPSVPMISFPEWYTKAAGGLYNFILGMSYPENLKSRSLVNLDEYNLLSLKALSDADCAVVPTEFQRAQFPDLTQQKLTVLHEGIDDQFYDIVAGGPAHSSPTAAPEREEKKVVTFITRSMEPLRGYGVFLEACRILCARRSDVVFEVAGNDEHQGYIPRPDPNIPWRRHLEGANPPDPGRYTFRGLVDGQSYRDLLRRSSVHIYMTAPYILSWSMIEAMAAGCAIVASATPPVTELIRDGESGLLFPFADAMALADAVERVLDADPAVIAAMRQAARKAAEPYRATCLGPALAEIIARTMLPKSAAEFRSALARNKAAPD